MIASMSRSSSSRRRALEQSARIGSEVKLARITHGMTGRQVADRAGVSWSTEMRVELGDPNVTITTVCAVTEAVGLDFVGRTYAGQGPTLRDTGQLQFAEHMCAQAHASWQPTIELLVGAHGECIDVALFGPQEIWASEIERMATDFQARYRRADRKRAILAELHQRPVRLLLVIEDTRRNRAAMEPHLPVIRAALPAGTREVMTALRTGRPLGRDGLAWMRRPPRTR
jgi:transcriptional regulator with XRE-family HTH domain